MNSRDTDKEDRVKEMRNRAISLLLAIENSSTTDEKILSIIKFEHQVAFGVLKTMASSLTL